ncbi:hypothetical protein LCGC14_1008200, partial [marine sediment metagenome]
MLKTKKKVSQTNLMIKALLDILPANYLIKQGFPAIIQNDQIIMRSVFGLNFFLSSWIEEESDYKLIISEISKFLENYKDYIDYTRYILKFIHDKGRIPEKDEAWELNIPIDEMDLVLDLINVNIKEEVFSKLNLVEKKYFDELSKPIILSKNKLEEFKLEDLTTNYGLDLINAKILPLFINDILNIDNLNNEIEKYLNLSELTDKHLSRLNKLGTKITKLNLSKEKELSLLDLARKIKASIMETGESLYFLNNTEKFIVKEFSKKKAERLSEKLTEALRYCIRNNEELNLNMLITQFNLDLITANEVIILYGKKFSLPERLSKQETKKLDLTSKSVIKYIKEINEKPTIEDLIINLNLNIRDATIIITFINKMSVEALEEDFERYSEKELLEIDNLSCDILTLYKDAKTDRDLINLAHQVEAGIYSIKRALLYISWIENTINDQYIYTLSDQEKKILDGKISSALKYIVENELELEFQLLIEEVGFNFKDSNLIIRRYNQIISNEINIDTFTERKKTKIEALARKIYKTKKSGEINSYEPEEILSLNIESSSLEELWEAIVYLKVKVLNVLVTESRIIKTEIGKIRSEGNVQLKERHGTKISKREAIQLSKGSIKLQDANLKFKTSAEKVQLKRGMDFVGGLIRYKVAIKNKTDMLINNLEVSLQMTAEHMRIVDIKPRVYKKGDRAKIPSMSPKQSESVDFYLEPMICGSIPVAPITTYIDAFGNPQMTSKERLMVISKCPPIINPGEENIAKVKNIYESNDIIRSFRTFELEHDPSKTFILIMEAIGAWAGKTVSKPIYESQEPFTAEVYYYILNQIADPNLGHQEQIIIKIRVDEEKNIAFLNIGAETNPTVNGVLTHIWQLANERFGEAFGYEFMSLHCPECGGSVDNIGK